MKKYISILAMTVTITGCATITGNGEQTVFFDTKQNELTLYNYSGKEKVCDLPCFHHMDGNDFRSFVIRGNGYKAKSLTLDISRNKATYANLVSIANLGDSLTGASSNIQSYVFIELEKLDRGSSNE